MTTHRLGLIMNGVTGRMGTNQHLVRSICAIRAEGGVRLANGDCVMPDPILVGRNEAKLAALAAENGIERWTTDLDAALADRDDTLFFDAATTQMRKDLLLKAIGAGKDIYTEKPVAETLDDALAIARAARDKGVRGGVVHDKLSLPGLIKLRMLRDAGFFGRILSVRGEFGYWVFEGDWQPAQRPSWNYRKAEGGGIILDMLCHWRYVLDHTIAPVRSVCCHGADPHSRTLGRGRRRATTPMSRTRPTPCSSLRAASSPRSTPPGAPGCGGTIWRPSMSTAPTARRSPG